MCIYVFIANSTKNIPVMPDVGIGFPISAARYEEMNMAGRLAVFITACLGFS